MRLVDLLVEITSAKKATDYKYETIQKNLGLAFSQKKRCRDFFNEHSPSHSYFSKPTMPVTEENFFVFNVTYSEGERMIQITYYGNHPSYANGHLKYETDVFPLKEFNDFMDVKEEKSTSEIIKGINDENEKSIQAANDRNNYINELSVKFKEKRNWAAFFSSRSVGEVGLDSDFFEGLLSVLNFVFTNDDKMRIELTDYSIPKTYYTRFFPVDEFVKFIENE